MYLRKVTYQLCLRVKSLVPCFHKSHLENLALLVIGIAYSRSVSLPKAAGAVLYKRSQVESRVERFERLLRCEKLIPLNALKPVARKVLKSLHTDDVINSRRRYRAGLSWRKNASWTCQFLYGFQQTRINVNQPFSVEHFIKFYLIHNIK